MPKKSFAALCGREDLKKVDLFELVQIKKELYPELNLDEICKVYGVTRQGYWKWQKSKNKRDIFEEGVRDYILEIQTKHHFNYGAKRVTKAIRDDYALIVNHKYVAKIMKKYGLNSVMKNKKYHKPGPAMKDFTNLKRNFQADTPYDKLVQDITEVKFKKQKAYINIIKDLCTKKIVAYNISVSPTVEFVLDTIKQIETNTIKYGTYLHTDQGFQYTHQDYLEYIKSKNFIPSFSRRGTPIDNACIESFNSILKRELINNPYCKFENMNELIQEIEKFIEYYNSERIQAGLEYLTPNEYEEKYQREFTRIAA